MFPEKDSHQLQAHTLIIRADTFESSNSEGIIVFSVRPSLDDKRALTLTVSINNGAASLNFLAVAQE